MIAICRHNIRVHNIELLVSLQSQLGDETREWNVARNNGKWKMWLQQGGKTSITALGRHFMSKQSQESFAKRRQAEYEIITFNFPLLLSHSIRLFPLGALGAEEKLRCERGKSRSMLWTSNLAVCSLRNLMVYVMDLITFRWRFLLIYRRAECLENDSQSCAIREAASAMKWKFNFAENGKKYANMGSRN